MKRISCLFLCIFSCLFSVTAIAQQSSPVLTVEVTGAEADTGQILLSLFSSEENYLSEPIRALEMSVDENGTVVFQLIGLTLGTYSISAIYDKDNDGSLDTGFLGIPSELVGFSNNAKGLFGPPSFDKTSFDFPAQPLISIQLGKAKD